MKISSTKKRVVTQRQFDIRSASQQQVVFLRIGIRRVSAVVCSVHIVPHGLARSRVRGLSSQRRTRGRVLRGLASIRGII